jgi:hypothetical protein
LKIAFGLGALLLAAALWCRRQIARGNRRRARPGLRRSLLILGPPVLATFLWWYVFYAPRSLPLPLGPRFLSVWTLPFIDYITAVLLGWAGLALLFALFPRSPRTIETGEAAS